MHKSTIVARRKGAWSARSDNACLWKLSKRELIEVALHLAAGHFDSAETSLETNLARDSILAEHRTLKHNGLI